jgi:MFS family permease
LPPSNPTSPPLPSTTTTVVVTTLIQSLTALCSVSVPVLAPTAGREMGFSPTLAGYFVGIMYVGAATVALLTGSLVLRYGSIRVSQGALLLCAVSMVLLAVLPLPLMPIAALILGAGYGPITPASSHVLAKTTPPHMMSLMFSLKQTGVTLGGAMAGLLLPPLTLAFNWHVAALTVAAMCIITIGIAQILRPALDSDRNPRHPISVKNFIHPFRLLFAEFSLVRLTLTGATFAGLQMCFTAYIVAYLTHDLGYTLAAAGLALAFGNFGGIAGRIVWGVVADRTRAPRVVLGILGVAMTTAMFCIAAIGPAWPTVLVLGVCLAFGLTGVSWNGVQIAETARLSPPGLAAMVSGAGTFITFWGIILMPPLFAALHDATDSFRIPFVVLALPALLTGCWQLARRKG